MEIAKISLKEFFLFNKSIYQNDNNFKDNKSGLIEVVCHEKRPFYAHSKQVIIAVKDGAKTLCACVLIVHKNAPEMLSIAFFEALPDSADAVNLLMGYVENYGKQMDCAKIVVSLDGHVNNSVAFSAGQGEPSFGESYCWGYYHDYFKNFNKIKFISLCDEADLVKQRIAGDMPMLEKSAGKIEIEHADFGSGFRATMKRYTDLNNEIFTDHRYYFPREYEEDYDLFKSMRPLLKNKNLIFAKCEGKDIGFILWYPDFNELVPLGKGASAATFIKYRLFRQEPETTKVVEIGVSAKYRRYGTILMLFNAALESTAKNTEKILSSWILDKNIKSKATASRYITEKHKDYYAYEKEI